MPSLVCPSLAAVLLALPAVAAHPNQEGEAQRAFHAARQDAQEALRKREWKQAEAGLLQALEAHAGQDYARPYLRGIEDDLRRAGFWQEADVPDSDDLISGDLLRYSSSSGLVRIRYTAKNAGDFASAGGIFEHPAFFADDWTVEFQGISDELRRASMVVNFDWEEIYILDFGSLIEGEDLYYQHTLSRLGGPGLAERDILERIKPRNERRANEKIKAKVTVSDRKIEVHYGGRKIMSVENPTGSFGTLAWAQGNGQSFRPFGQFIVSGKVDTGWMTGLLDAAVARERQAFDAAWQRPKALDAWPALEEDSEGDLSFEEIMERIQFVTKFRSESEKTLAAKVRELAGNGRLQVQALYQQLELKGEEMLLPSTLAQLRFQLAMGLDRPSLALESLDALVFAEGSELESAVLTAELFASAGRLDEAEQHYAELASAHPELTYAFRRQAECALLQGQPARAAAAIQAGLGESPLSATLHELEWKTIQARKGPSWKVVRTKEGQHFQLHAETNKKLAHQAMVILDEAWERAADFFGPLLDQAALAPRPLGGADSGPHSIAYLFAGEAGYLDYVRDIAANDHEATLGIYTPLLKQIVAWNQPSYAALRETLRHEVAHRYLDLALGNRIPRWLNEGLAETFAASWTRQGEFQPGGIHEHWILAIQSLGKVPHPSRFFYQDDAAFAVNSEANYALAWAMVHFLTQESKVGQSILPAALQHLAAGADPAHALDLALEQVDGTELYDEYLKWLNATTKKLR